MKRVICAGTMAALSALVFSACSGGSGLTPSASGQGAGFTSPAFMDAAKRPRAGTKIVKLAWGKVPAARAGATVTVKLTLTAKAKNGKAIKGAYANPVSLADSDKSGATKLLINGKAASKKNRVKKSTDKISLRYTGLAISPATLTASAAKVKAAKATFSPSIGGIAYTCTSSSSQTCSTTAASPEIDLYATSGTGATGTFTATQAGWAGGSFNQPYTYAFSAISGQSNDCPGTTGAAYAVSPASGTAGSSFSVAATSGAAAGECLLTIAGAGSQTLAVTLTYSTTGIGVGVGRVH